MIRKTLEILAQSMTEFARLLLTMKPVSALDVAAYVLEQAGPMSAWKLQKLTYYSQAWCLVWNGQPLFREEIEAWAKGPVVRALYQAHRGMFSVSPGQILGNSRFLSPIQRDQVDAVLEHYGKHDGDTLSELTHAEGPWNEARTGIEPDAPSSVVIVRTSMMRYYRTQANNAKDRLDAVFARATASDSMLKAANAGWDALEASGVVNGEELLDSL